MKYSLQIDLKIKTDLEIVSDVEIIEVSESNLSKHMKKRNHNIPSYLLTVKLTNSTILQHSF